MKFFVSKVSARHAPGSGGFGIVRRFASFEAAWGWAIEQTRLSGGAYAVNVTREQRATKPWVAQTGRWVLSDLIGSHARTGMVVV